MYCHVKLKNFFFMRCMTKKKRNQKSTQLFKYKQFFDIVIRHTLKNSKEKVTNFFFFHLFIY